MGAAANHASPAALTVHLCGAQTLTLTGFAAFATLLPTLLDTTILQ